jgi:hypothetical protein
MNIEAQKNLSTVLALIVILGLVGIPSSPIHVGCGGACCARYEGRLPQHSMEPRGGSHVRSCCCEVQEARCDALEDCASALPAFAFFVVTTTITPASACPAPGTTNLHHPFDSQGGLSNNVFSSGTVSSAMRLFLLNVSLLC